MRSELKARGLAIDAGGEVHGASIRIDVHARDDFVTVSWGGPSSVYIARDVAKFEFYSGPDILVHHMTDPASDSSSVIVLDTTGTVRAKIKNVYPEFEEVRIWRRLAELGAEYKGSFLFRCATFAPLDESDVSWFRIRDEGYRTVLVTKSRLGREHDHECEVTSFERVRFYLKDLGFEQTYFTEKMCDLFMLDKAVIACEAYPALPPLLVVGAESAKRVDSLAAQLDLGAASSAGPEDMYRSLYGISLKKRGDLTFGGVVPTLGGHVTKNREAFERLAETQATEAREL